MPSSLVQQPSGAVPFAERLRSTGNAPLRPHGIETLQVNVGYTCNQACGHCHLAAGPERSESMSRETAVEVLEILSENHIGTLDITGGAPELNPNLRLLVAEARKLGRRAIVRTNLSILTGPGMVDLPAFYREHDVELVASLPCYLEANVNGMRGNGIFQRSLVALQKLNELGYGSDATCPLSLVYNPAGPFLPPPQVALEQEYRRELGSRYGIVFTRLYTITNMPIGRFRDKLMRANALEAYQGLLVGSFNPRTLDRLMCRRTVSVGWDGTLHDCDFNQALGLPMNAPRAHISRFDHASLSSRLIATGDHCYACTAGQGST